MPLTTTLRHHLKCLFVLCAVFDRPTEIGLNYTSTSLWRNGERAETATQLNSSNVPYMCTIVHFCNRGLRRLSCHVELCRVLVLVKLKVKVVYSCLMELHLTVSVTNALEVFF